MAKSHAETALEGYLADLLAEDALDPSAAREALDDGSPRLSREEENAANTPSLTVEIPPSKTRASSPLASSNAANLAQRGSSLSPGSERSSHNTNEHRPEVDTKQRGAKPHVAVEVRALQSNPSTVAKPISQANREASATLDAPVTQEAQTTLEVEKRRQLQDMLSPRTDENLAETIPASLAEPEVAPLISEQKVVTETEPDATEKAATAESTALQPLLSWGDNGRPHWANERFDVLLFDVSGLSLAVPLVALGQIVPLTDKLTFLQGQSDWFMGILPSPIGDIRTINTALFVMPERDTSGFAASAKYVVTIDGMPWGLAVDKVNQPITVAPDDVKWRTLRTQRPWLAGTVKSHMCALIDVPQMGLMLKHADKSQSADKS